MKSARYILLGIGLFMLQESLQSQAGRSIGGTAYYSQGKSNRTAAEWEPAKGVMIVWPLCIPHKLVIELAKDSHLYTLVEDDSARMDAQKWYDEWGIDPAHNTFIFSAQGVDAWWTRDWGPSAVFLPDGTMKLGDGKYIYSTPVTTDQCNDSLKFLYVDSNNNIIRTETDDQATVLLAKGLNHQVLDLPFINTGGNVLTDGLGTAFSTCILLNENRFHKVGQDQFFEMNKRLLGFERYHIISNFEKLGIQHIDCFMKVLDEERILVAEPPVNHELHPVYEAIIEQELKKLKTFYGRPYEILRLKTEVYGGDKLAAYTNSIIVNKTIYVPLFRIKGDSVALETWRQLMPGYKVKGFEFVLKDEPRISAKMYEQYTSGYGWNNGDALHCRVRAVWDDQMLFISTRRMDKHVGAKHRNLVWTTIIDYSKKGLVKGRNRIFWRTLGERGWKSADLQPTEDPTQFYYEIPFHQQGTAIEYYIGAESKSGRKETQPRTAPMGTYKFFID